MSADRETTISKWSAGLQVKWKLLAQRAQIHQCEPIKSGALAWQFREPIATLIDGATSVGQLRGTEVAGRWRDDRGQGR